MAYPAEKLQVKWIHDGVTDEAVEWTKSFSEFLTSDNNALTTSQIRKFFGELKRIQADYSRFIQDLPMLKAQLAYAVGRNRGSKIKEFYEELTKGLGGIRKDNKVDFHNFVKIVESIVAFHKYFGGK
jgi:CRISPR-associated protein Csm2